MAILSYIGMRVMQKEDPVCFIIKNTGMKFKICSENLRQVKWLYLEVFDLRTAVGHFMI
jgi:hypothetical protein